jgi:recombinational DNA repair protein RecR
MEVIVPQILTGFILDKNSNQIKPSFDPIDPEEIKKISEKRISICQSCELFSNKGSCQFCGCNMSYKSTLLYPLDDDGKAIQYVDSLGRLVYTCNLKKW